MNLSAAVSRVAGVGSSGASGRKAARRDPIVAVPGEASRRTGLWVVCILLVAFFGTSYDNFATVDNGLAIALNVSSIAIAGIGTAALLTSGNVDLSIGGQYALISVLVAATARDTQSTVAAIAVGLTAGATLGLLNGLLVRRLQISPLIVTLGMMLVYRGLAFVVSDAASIFGFPQSFLSIGQHKLLGFPIPVIIAAVVFTVGSVLLTTTVHGLRAYALGGNEDAARRSGVSVGRTVVGLFVLNGLLIGVVATLATARLTSGTPTLGDGFELDVLTAVILGGVAFNGGSGHPLGVLAGVATIGVLNAGLIFAGLSDWYQQIARGGVLILALAADQFTAYRRARSIEETGRTEHIGNGTAPLAVDATAVPDRGSAANGTLRRSRRPVTGSKAMLEARNLSKRFGSVVAVRDVSFDVRPGEVVCLVGDNGAGKSTLIKMAAGALTPDGGTFTFDGKEVHFHSPRDAREAGIETVYQDLALCPNLSVAHNLVLGDERRRRLGIFSIRDDRRATALARERLASLGITLPDIQRPVSWLSGGQRQSVAIARALQDDVKLVILDEPTAALGVRQTANVLRHIRTAADRGVAVILISHEIQNIFDVGDRVVILRLGSVIHDGAVSELADHELVHMMAGLSVPTASHASSASSAPAETATD
jgi:ribose/xylose/arabinose/galactoside ABC-type transport system permease subunit/ABC-type branched-subunit amino acid transport system ATPase component